MVPADAQSPLPRAAQVEWRCQLQFELRLLRSGPERGWRAELLAPPAPDLVFESLADLIDYLSRLDGQSPARGIR